MKETSGIIERWSFHVLDVRYFHSLKNWDVFSTHMIKSNEICYKIISFTRYDKLYQ